MYCLGDASATKWAPTAQVAVKQGKYLASFFNDLGNFTQQDIEKTKAAVGPFSYEHFGTLAYIGSDKAIADFPGGIKMRGMLTYFVWRSAYLSKY